MVTGRGRDVNGDGDFDDEADVLPSSIGWREGALPVVVFATDAEFHDRSEDSNYPGATKEEALGALRDKGVVVFGMQSGSWAKAESAIGEVVNATGGVAFQLDGASSEIAAKISDALDATLESFNVTLDAIAGAEWIERIEPKVQEASPSDTMTFTVRLKGIRRSSVEDLQYTVYLWARADGTAVIKRVAIPIDVPM